MQALQYQICFDTPMQLVREFFTNTFAPEQFSDPQSQASIWRQITLQMLENFQFIPFTLFFHPAIVAAGFLEFARTENSILIQSLYGHDWFLYVDQGLDQNAVNQMRKFIIFQIEVFNWTYQMLPAPQAPLQLQTSHYQSTTNTGQNQSRLASPQTTTFQRNYEVSSNSSGGETSPREQ